MRDEQSNRNSNQSYTRRNQMINKVFQKSLSFILYLKGAKSVLAKHLVTIVLFYAWQNRFFSI